MRYRAFILLSLLPFSCADKEKMQIKEAVEYQLNNYPESRLTDVYKNFFQDFYGPGHLVQNTDMAISYLRQELEETVGCSLNLPVEGTGYKNNFVRVDLCLIKEGKIAEEDFIRLFMESADSFKEPEIRAWKKEWEKILRVIEHLDAEMEDFDRDKEVLNSMIEKGEYVVHHSEEYIRAYHPHYRIIRKDLAEKQMPEFIR